MRSSDGKNSAPGRVLTYQEQKQQVFQRYFVSGPARLDKGKFKQLTKQFENVIGVDSRNASQLWQIVEEDTQGVVNKSYIEGIFDVVYEQHKEKLDLQFELTNGLRYVHQTVFKNSDTYRVPLQECVQVVQQGFNAGHEQLIEKIASISKNSQVDRVEMMDLIEHLEERQINQANESPSANTGQNSSGASTQDSFQYSEELLNFDENEEYSQARDREILGLLRVRVEAITKELERAQSVLKGTNTNTLRDLNALTQPVPHVLRSYGNYTRQIHLQMDRLQQELESLKSSNKSDNSKTSDELKKANDQIFILQTELEEKNRVMAGVVQEALSKIQEKLNKQFSQTKLELEEQIVLLEGKLRNSEKELRLAENRVTSLLSVNANMENRLKVATDLMNPKLQQMLEKALDDPAFFDKVVQAVDLQERAAKQGSADPFGAEVDLEMQELKERVQQLTQVNEESDNYIQKLHNELRELKENLQSNADLKSGFGVSGEGATLAELGVRESVTFDRTSNAGFNFNRLSIAKPEFVLDFWCDTILRVEGKNTLASKVRQLEDELRVLSEKSNKDQADLRDTRRNLDAIDGELRLLKQEKIGLESSLGVVKADLSSKLIQVGNLTSQIATLQAKLKQQPATEDLTVVAVTEVEPTTEAPKPDYNLDAARNKTNQILENNSLLESLRKPRAPRTEPGEAVFRNGVRVLDTLDKTTAIIDLCIPGRMKQVNPMHSDSHDDGFDFKAAYLKKVGEKTELVDKIEALNKKITELEALTAIAAAPVEQKHPETHDLGVSAIVFEEDQPTQITTPEVATITTATGTDEEVNLGESQFGETIPTSVPIEEYEELQQKYQFRLVELDNRAEQVEQLTKRCEELVRRVATSEEKHEAELLVERERFQKVQVELEELASMVEMLKQELDLSRVQYQQLEQDALNKTVVAPPTDLQAQFEEDQRASLFQSTLDFKPQDPPKLVEAEIMEQAEETINIRMSTLRQSVRGSVLNANHFSVAAVSKLLPTAAAEQVREMEQELFANQKKLEEKDTLISNLREMLLEYQAKLQKVTQDKESQTEPLAEQIAVVPAVDLRSSINLDQSRSFAGIKQIYEERIQRLSDRIETLEKEKGEFQAKAIETQKKEEKGIGNLFGLEFAAITSMFGPKRDIQEPPKDPEVKKKDLLSSMFGMDVAPSTKSKTEDSIRQAQISTANIPDERTSQKGSGNLNFDVLLPSTILQEKYAPATAAPVKPIHAPNIKSTLYESVLFGEADSKPSNPYLEPNPTPASSQHLNQGPGSKFASQPQKGPNQPMIAANPAPKDFSLALPRSGETFYPQPPMNPPNQRPQYIQQPSGFNNYPQPPMFGQPPAQPESGLKQPSFALPPGFANQGQNALPPGFLDTNEGKNPFKALRTTAPQQGGSFGIAQANQAPLHDNQTQRRPSIQTAALMTTAFNNKSNSKKTAEISKRTLTNRKVGSG